MTDEQIAALEKLQFAIDAYEDCAALIKELAAKPGPQGMELTWSRAVRPTLEEVSKIILEKAAELNAVIGAALPTQGAA
jgi:hypothetical protein